MLPVSRFYPRVLGGIKSRDQICIFDRLTIYEHSFVKWKDSSFISCVRSSLLDESEHLSVPRYAPPGLQSTRPASCSSTRSTGEAVPAFCRHETLRSCKQPWCD